MNGANRETADRRRRLVGFSRDPATPRALLLELSADGSAQRSRGTVPFGRVFLQALKADRLQVEVDFAVQRAKPGRFIGGDHQARIRSDCCPAGLVCDLLKLSVIADFGQYDLRVNPNNEHELFLPDGRAAGNLLFREKLPTAQGTSFPRPNQFHAHGYVNEINDAVECVLEPERSPQSGPLLAWDTLAVLMASYESSAAGGGFVELQPYREGREFLPAELPDPRRFGSVFQRRS